MATPPSRRSLVMVTTTFPRHPGDGTPEFVLTLAESLTGWDVTVVTPRVPGVPTRTHFGDVEVVRVPYLPARFESVAGDGILPGLRSDPRLLLQVPFLVLGLLVGTWREVRRTHAAVVNAHWILPAGWIALVLRRLIGVPYLVTVHGADAYALHGRPFRWIKNMILRRAGATAPVSADIRRALGRDSDPVLPMGVDTASVRAAVGERAPEADLLVMVGRLADKKGFDVAVRALAQTGGLRLEIIGDGPERDRLRRLVDELGVGDRVVLRGKCPRTDVMDALRRARAVVIPSRIAPDGDRDGTPVVLCEAMAAGVPVVASDLGGLGEHIESGVTGVLVPPGDVTALAGALEAISGGAVDLDAMGRHAAEYAQHRLDVGAIAAEYERLLAEVSDGTRR